MEINQKIVNDVVRNLGVTPDKDLGQNFLIDSQVCSRIAEALELNENDDALEIGGGLGSLTHFLVNKSSNLDVVDIDLRMCNFLKTVYKENEANTETKKTENTEQQEYPNVFLFHGENISKSYIRWRIAGYRSYNEAMFSAIMDLLQIFLKKRGIFLY